MPQFERLNRLLRERGIARRCALRMVAELQDHYEDLLDEFLESGVEPAAARALAREMIGSNQAIAAAAAQQIELLQWSQRYPRMSAISQSVLCVAAWPAAPFYYCAHQRHSIARWGVSISAASVVTATMLLGLYSVVQ